MCPKAILPDILLFFHLCKILFPHSLLYLGLNFNITPQRKLDIYIYIYIYYKTLYFLIIIIIFSYQKLSCALELFVEKNYYKVDSQ